MREVHILTLRPAVETVRVIDLEPREWDRLPIPFACVQPDCGNEALYARNGKQFCAACWQREIARTLSP